MSRPFLQSISRNLSDINTRMALDFLCLFSDCLKVWEWDDRQSRIRLRYTITAFQRLWDNSSSDAQAFYSLAFEVQGLIQKSKLLVEQWCEYNLASSSSSMQKPKNPDSPPTILSFERFQTIMQMLYKYSAAKIVPFKKQMDILIDKIRFMEKMMSNPVAASCTDSNKHLRLMKFTAAFDIKATCLVLLLWAKQETATEAEISILLFNTLHSLMTNAPDVIVLISQNLQPSSPDYFILLSATVASLVDFFFEHLVDDARFLILRDPLIRLFTSLSTHHNASSSSKRVVPSVQCFDYNMLPTVFM